MKRFFISIFCSLACIFIYAQQSNDIAIGIIVPEQQEDVKADAFQLLSTKLETIAVGNGVSSDAYGTFVMYPIVNIIDKQIVEGGLHNLYVVEIEMSLFIKQMNDKAVFGSCTKKLKGSGRNMSEAVKNAFSKINANDNVYAQFYSNTKDKIGLYYESNKNNIIWNAKSMAELQQYEQALSLLTTYPQSLKGAEDIKKVAIDIFKKYQNMICTSIIAKAKGVIAMQDYETAIGLLAEIDSESVCKDDALKLTQQIENQIKDEQKKELDFKNKLVDNEMTLESKRINAIRDIGVEYARHYQPKITYTQIIK